MLIDICVKLFVGNHTCQCSRVHPRPRRWQKLQNPQFKLFLEWAGFNNIIYKKSEHDIGLFLPIRTDSILRNLQPFGGNATSNILNTISNASVKTDFPPWSTSSLSKRRRGLHWQSTIVNAAAEPSRPRFQFFFDHWHLQFSTPNHDSIDDARPLQSPTSSCTAAALLTWAQDLSLQFLCSFSDTDWFVIDYKVCPEVQRSGHQWTRPGTIKSWHWCCCFRRSTITTPVASDLLNLRCWRITSLGEGFFFFIPSAQLPIPLSPLHLLDLSLFFDY